MKHAGHRPRKEPAHPNVASLLNQKLPPQMEIKDGIKINLTTSKNLVNRNPTREIV